MELSFSPEAKNGPTGECRVVSTQQTKKGRRRNFLGIIRWGKTTITTTTHIECVEKKGTFVLK